MVVVRSAGPAELRFVPGYTDALSPDPDDWCVAVRRHLVLVPPTAALPRVGDVPGVRDLRNVGTLDGVPVWAGIAPPAGGCLAERSWKDIVTREGMPMAAVAVRGVYDVTWRATHRHCGGCGTSLESCAGFPTRRCPQCDLVPFVPQQLSPAVLVAVRRDDELLMVRHAGGSLVSSWALIAGFVEAGERLEDTVRREVWEEAGVRVDDVRYVDSQPWSLDDPGVLLVAFTAKWAGGEPAVDGTELTEARWVTRQALREFSTADLPPEYSFASRLVQDFAAAVDTVQR